VFDWVLLTSPHPWQQDRAEVTITAKNS